MTFFMQQMFMHEESISVAPPSLLAPEKDLFHSSYALSPCSACD